MRRSILAVAALLASTSAFAQTIDQSGADALAASLKRYVGQSAFDKKFMTVEVDGDAYRLGVDFSALVAAMPKGGSEKVTAAIGPYALRVKPRSDGTWDVAGPLAPDGSFEAEGPDGAQKAEWTIGNGSFTGVFDPALAYFSSASGSNDSIKMTTVAPTEKVDVTVGKGSFELTGKAGANGGVDISQKQTLADFVEVISGASEGGGPPLDIAVRSTKLDVVADGTGFRMPQMVDILAFAVENGDKEKFEAAQAQFKQLLNAALPFWDRLTGSYAFNEFSAGTPYGIFSADKFGFDLDMTGISKNGTINYAFSVAALKMPEGVAPAWSVPILPTDITMEFGGANLNLDGPARKFIEAMEISKDPPISDAVSEEIKVEFLATNPKMTLTETSIRNKDTEITINGEMTFPNEKPQLTATLEATGFDKLEAGLQAGAASDPSVQQIIPVVAMAKGFGTAMPDGKLQWIVEMAPDGSVKVNGTMLKGPDPVTPELPLDPNAPAPGVTNPQ